MNFYNAILQDLQLEEPQTPIVTPPLYNINSTPLEKVKTLDRQLRRAKRLHNQKEMLSIAWYLGQVIETQTDSPAQRTLCLNALTEHYKTVAVKTYYLFEFIGIEQIERTKNTTLTMIRRLKQKEYNQLRNEAMTIAGARL
jgi:hypothetical protein